MQAKIVFVVGYENWGKSETLRALTEGNSHRRRITINEEGFYIRRMSNDDKPDEYVVFMKSLDPSERSYLIAALCPNFERTNAHTATILKSLRKKKYDLFFWVIEHTVRHFRGRDGGADFVSSRIRYCRSIPTGC